MTSILGTLCVAFYQLGFAPDWRGMLTLAESMWDQKEDWNVKEIEAAAFGYANRGAVIAAK